MLPIQKVQYIKDPLKPFTTSQLRRDKFNLRINKMTEKLKEIANSVWLAPVLIGLLFSYNVYSSQQAALKQVELATQLTQVQKDLVVLQTQKQDEDKRRSEDRQTMERNQEMDRAWRENIRKDFTTLQLIVQGKFPQQNNHSQAMKEE